MTKEQMKVGGVYYSDQTGAGGWFKALELRKGGAVGFMDDYDTLKLIKYQNIFESADAMIENYNETQKELAELYPQKPIEL